MGDLLDLFNNKLFNEDLYSLFDKQSINNKIAYYNFYVYTLQLQKYCYDLKTIFLLTPVSLDVFFKSSYKF